MKKLVVMSIGSVLLFFSAVTILAQAPVPPTEPTGEILSPDQLDQLVGPIALYPDPLIAEILPAATFPTEIVMANRYVSQGGDPNQIPDQGWDPSVQALAHYANVLKWMDDNLTWTTQLGQAFQNQQADIMNAIQALRSKAQGLGNLTSNPQESVVTDDGDIEIEPTDPDQMYVPEYDPNTIYFQPGVYCTFPFWLPVGGWLVNDWDWHHHGLIFWGPGHPRPGNWWHESPAWRHTYITSHPVPAWHPGSGLVPRTGWQRGYSEPAIGRAPAVPRDNAPLIVNVHPAPIDRQPIVTREAPRPYVAPREEAPRTFAAPREEAPRVEAPREEVHSAPAAGFYGGGQTGREAVESSSRGQASRASTGGGGGGGGGKHR